MSLWGSAVNAEITPRQGPPKFPVRAAAILSAYNCSLPFISSNCQLLLKQLRKEKKSMCVCVSLFPVPNEYSEVIEQASASQAFPLP